MSRISLDTYRARYEAQPLTAHKARLLLALDVAGKAADRGDYMAALFWATEARDQARRLQEAENLVTGKRRRP